MHVPIPCRVLLIACSLALTTIPTSAQRPDDGRPRPARPEGERGERPEGGRPDRGGPMNRRTTRELAERFDEDGDGRLSQVERGAARKFIEENPVERGRGFGRRRGGRSPRDAGGPPRGRRGRDLPPPSEGVRVSPADVEPIDAPLYEPNVLRTIFVDFDSDDWEKELEVFHGTDIEVPAVLTVDGKTYAGCGMRFRGASSYMMVQSGYKRSFNVSVDYTDEEQRLLGYKTLNLLNCNGDASLLSTVLYSRIANAHMPAPKANLVRVVINGENWGIYTNVQQFNKQFVEEHYGSSKGARWKVAGSPRGGGGLDYLGDDPAAYEYPYVLKGGNKEKSTAKLVELCRVLDQTPVDQLEAELSKILDVDELLWFLALDISLCNSDGYWTRASDYSLYLDPDGRFHVIPHDMNEAFRKPGGGPGRPGGRRREQRPEDQTVDPLHGLDDATKPLRSKVLAVPSLRAKYLERVRAIADELDWQRLGPVVAQFRDLLAEHVAQETRGLASHEEFMRATSSETEQDGADDRASGPGGRGAMNVRAFTEWRRSVLLKGQAAK